MKTASLQSSDILLFAITAPVRSYVVMCSVSPVTTCAPLSDVADADDDGCSWVGTGDDDDAITGTSVVADIVCADADEAGDDGAAATVLFRIPSTMSSGDGAAAAGFSPVVACTQHVVADIAATTSDLRSVILRQTKEAEHHGVDWCLSPVLNFLQHEIKRFRAVCSGGS